MRNFKLKRNQLLFWYIFLFVMRWLMQLQLRKWILSSLTHAFQHGLWSLGCMNPAILLKICLFSFLFSALLRISKILERMKAAFSRRFHYHGDLVMFLIFTLIFFSAISQCNYNIFSTSFSSKNFFDAV